ncbi:hypothetical protein HGRIS_005476 [Hohenbuehelia grisea]|uniref:Cytochrome P450 n=1 Tax=Hohenbuehelia grisea TaxID=104357 RepID=A0ABR3JZ68_9AGAR
MALHPDKQDLAQRELDAVVGSQRMPVIADKADLPYINAVIKETMRWHPIVPLTLGRRSSKDDIYRGYFIPKHSMIIPNVWAIAFEENAEYNPREFIPERFLDPTQSVVDPALWAFGFGKRPALSIHNMSWEGTGRELRLHSNHFYPLGVPTCPTVAWKT